MGSQRADMTRQLHVHFETYNAFSIEIMIQYSSWFSVPNCFVLGILFQQGYFNSSLLVVCLFVFPYGGKKILSINLGYKKHLSERIHSSNRLPWCGVIWKGEEQGELEGRRLPGCKWPLSPSASIWSCQLWLCLITSHYYNRQVLCSVLAIHTLLYHWGPRKAQLEDNNGVYFYNKLSYADFKSKGQLSTSEKSGMMGTKLKLQATWGFISCLVWKALHLDPMCLSLLLPGLVSLQLISQYETDWWHT